MLRVTEKLHDAEQHESARPERIRLSCGHRGCEAEKKSKFSYTSFAANSPGRVAADKIKIEDRGSRIEEGTSEFGICSSAAFFADRE
jgi:hypothetical protein